MEDRTCSVEGCDWKSVADALCSIHYGRRRRHGDPLVPPQRIRGGRPCTVEGCDQRANAKGLCPTHYLRVRRTGEPGDLLAHSDERLCGYCETPFPPNDVRHKYCGEECSATAKSLREAYRRYGITMQEYRAMSLRQDGKCAICRHPERTERNRLLTIDHDHVSGHIRELLCSHCNRAIGLLQDDPKIIRAAAAYVERNRQLRLIT